MKRNKIKEFIPYIIFIIGFAVLLWRSFMSFCWSDETFYFATADRFLKGDSIFKNDWFPTQLSAIILLPIYSLFVTITGSVNGVILFFRILYVIFELISSVIVYRIFRSTKHSQFFSFAAALTTMFYTHLNIATLSYYTVSVHCFLLAMLLIYYYFFKEKKVILIVSGVLFSLSVLALPTMAIAYFVIVLCSLILVLISYITKKRNTNSELLNGFCSFVDRGRIIEIFTYTLIGIAAIAAMFFVFLLNNVSIKDFISAIPYVLTDEEHITNMIYPLKKFFIGINEVYGIKAYAFYFLILVSAALTNFKDQRLVKYSVLIADLFLFITCAVCSFPHTGYIQTVFCLFALPVFFMTEKKDIKIMFLLYLPGLVFSLVYSYSSNGYLYILSMGHFLSSIAGIVFVDDFVNQEVLKDNGLYRKLLIGFSFAVIVCLCMFTVYLRINNVYRDAPLSSLCCQITDGPAKGLYTTSKHKEMYTTVYNVIMQYCQSSYEYENGGNIFITKLLPWGYMCTDMRCASPTTWRTPFNSTRLQPYYEMNPDRLPDKVLVLNEDYGSYDSCGDVVADPNPNLNDEKDGYLSEYLERENFTKRVFPCGILYVRK